MFRHRVRTPTPPFDEAAAERLLGGAPVDDLPDDIHPLGRLLAAASGAGDAGRARRIRRRGRRLRGRPPRSQPDASPQDALDGRLGPHRARGGRVHRHRGGRDPGRAARTGATDRARGPRRRRYPRPRDHERRRRRRRRRLGEHCAVDDLRHDDDQRRAERRGGAVGHGRCERYANRVWERERDRGGARGAVGPGDHDRPGQRRPGQRVRRRRQFGPGRGPRQQPRDPARWRRDRRQPPHPEPWPGAGPAERAARARAEEP